MSHDPPRRAPSDYAPTDFLDDPARLGLAASSIHTRAGTLAVFRTDNGSKEVFVFLHGLNGSWMSWTPLLDYLWQAGLLGTADVLVLDMRELALPVTSAGLKVFGGFLFNRVCSSWPDVHLVGHSFGGSLALVLAAAHPDRVRSVRLVAASFLRVYEEVRHGLPNPFSLDSIARETGRFRIASSLGPIPRIALMVAWKTGALRASLRSTYYAPALLPDRIVATIPGNFSSKTTRALIRLVRNVRLELSFSSIGAPVVAVVGETDPLHDVGDEAAFALTVRHSTTSIPGTGHCPHIERPNLTAAALFGARQSDCEGFEQMSNQVPIACPELNPPRP